ncbi:hypothetical protein F2P56_008574 [Juglans regia]|uniref:Uncharacterized mitochondrial protein AtMg00810-like n=2 Tax=Juglans regia TaxID=51240 RepID=A0A2I4DMM2_JUGRE|nr:uncharacterized mitochondrial protein AtMg00810-like [Juglans regia]KAF5471807.1 hypothetical protein F2P56_008574 [Juglans regia]
MTALVASTEPIGFKSATKNPTWLAAMDEEVQALQTTRTWILRLETHLVAKGYTQVPGLDYNDTFSPVIKATSVHVVLSIDVTNKWPLQQLEVKNAFLNGTLTENVYMEQPPSYIDHRFPNHVCNNSSLLSSFTCKLNSEFATKDLGSLSYFLDLKALSTKDGLFIIQLKYAGDILTRAQLLDRSQSLQISRRRPPILDHHVPRHCPCGQLCQPISTHSTTDQFLVVKRILGYDKGTLHFGLTFHSSATPGALVAYFDADWAECPITHCSTSGYSIYLGNNLVSWSANKQPTVSHSSCEPEYRALAHIAA